MAKLRIIAKPEIECTLIGIAMEVGSICDLVGEASITAFDCEIEGTIIEQ